MAAAAAGWPGGAEVELSFIGSSPRGLAAVTGTREFGASVITPSAVINGDFSAPPSAP